MVGFRLRPIATALLFDRGINGLYALHKAADATLSASASTSSQSVMVHRIGDQIANHIGDLLAALPHALS